MLLRLTFLGTSAAQPTASRGLTALALRRAGELILFDCGEGTQRQMIRCAIGFLRTLSMLGRTAPLYLYGPRPAKRLLEVMLFAGTDALHFPIEIHELEAGAVVRRPGADVRAFQT